eukprot:3435889-Pyramimonas_sp.AAC.1
MLPDPTSRRHDPLYGPQVDRDVSQAQLAALKEEHGKAQRFSASMQEQNNRLQKEMAEKEHAIEKLQTERSGLQEEVGFLKGQATVLQ